MSGKHAGRKISGTWNKRITSEQRANQPEGQTEALAATNCIIPRPSLVGVGLVLALITIGPGHLNYGDGADGVPPGCVRLQAKRPQHDGAAPPVGDAVALEGTAPPIAALNASSLTRSAT